MRPGAPHHLDLNVSDLQRSTLFFEDPDRVKLEFVARGTRR
jgi:hypothetical protein